jgi:DNA-binding GntR family transcriptional regulator
MARKAATMGREAITKQERVYGILRERIRTGTYEPGHRIVIAQLAAEFGVSTLPVREAVRRVQAEGLVAFRPNAGACVAPADPEAADSIAELLAVVEGYATALAAPHLRNAEIERLRELTYAMEEASYDSAALAQLEREFHALLEAHCPNLALLRLLHDLARRFDAARRVLPFAHDECGAETVTGHRHLFELLAGSGSPAGIEQAARALSRRPSATTGAGADDMLTFATGQSPRSS